MIRPVPEDTITLRPRQASDADVPSSDLAIAGRSAAQPVAGVVLEAAFECDGRFVLFLTDDIPFEESLRIHLLGADLQLLDSATLGSMYSTGRFELLGLQQPGTVRFRFFGDTDWVVEVLDAPASRMPFFGDPRGVHRPFGFVRHFKVHGDPQPERSG
ncbi:hypothetical protein [Aquabacterium humicola]|uniref:hypothetical protein n=1 Tax=Aquabacterium humicola TaxID=3237377 RepID=UPI002543A47D|nr:hypothetical protein [Rubrivivax pictus]